MKKSISITILLSAILCSNLFSQNIGIDTTAVNLTISLPDTINLNDNYNHRITIENKSAASFTGTIWLITAVDTGGGIMENDSIGPIFVGNFNQNDTIGIPYNEVYNFGNNYKLGGNIVVVWPIMQGCSSCTTADSLYKNVFILTPTSINQNDNNFTYKIYPNPVKNELYIYNSSINNGFITILDVTGKTVKQTNLKSSVNLSFLPKGLYFIRIRDDKNEYIHKLIKE